MKRFVVLTGLLLVVLLAAVGCAARTKILPGQGIYASDDDGEYTISLALTAGEGLKLKNYNGALEISMDLDQEGVVEPGSKRAKALQWLEDNPPDGETE